MKPWYNAAAVDTLPFTCDMSTVKLEIVTVLLELVEGHGEHIV
jgi:hypothetical protein